MNALEMPDQLELTKALATFHSECLSLLKNSQNADGGCDFILANRAGQSRRVGLYERSTVQSRDSGLENSAKARISCTANNSSMVPGRRLPG